MRKLNLVYAPITRPRVPFGIALLKGFIQANSSVEVKCIDLNLAMYDDLIVGMGTGEVNVGKSRNQLLQAFAFFRSGDIDAFYDQAIYNGIIRNWLGGVDRAILGFSKSYERYAVRNVMKILENDPDVVGFSCMFDQQISGSLMLAQKIKEVAPLVQIVFGGNSVTQEIKENPFVDHVVIGEGENKLLAIVAKKLGKMENANVPFADFSDFELGRYFTPLPIVPMISSRGCSWRKCSFCVHHKIYEGGYRERNITDVLNEMERHVNAGIRHFAFVDEMISPARSKEIASCIIQRGMDVHWYCMAKPMKEFTFNTLQLMHDAGCKYVMWGMESGCQRILDLMNKGIRIEEIEGVLIKAAGAFIKNHVFIIAGFPTESENEFRETLQFLYEQQDVIHTVHKSRFELRKGSPIYQNPAKYGILKIHDRPGALGYEVESGTRQVDVRPMLDHYYNKFLRDMCWFSPASGMMREHALMHYSGEDRLVFNVKRQELPMVDDVPGWNEKELENEKYNQPCPYNKDVMCVQMPCDPEDDNYCSDGCPNRGKDVDADGNSNRDII